MIVLASASPRRRKLLSLICPVFSVSVSDIDESIAPGTEPQSAVLSLSLRKAKAAALSSPGVCVVAADTVVCVDGIILGKPRDEQEAREMLRLLSGRAHHVCTGVTVLSPGHSPVSFCEETRVEFYPLDEELINAYAATGEPMDKAGAYGIQGRGAVLVRRIEGDYNNVVGLPVSRLYRVLRELGQV